MDGNREYELLFLSLSEMSEIQCEVNDKYSVPIAVCEGVFPNLLDNSRIDL
jgi:hypothetical protein